MMHLMVQFNQHYILAGVLVLLAVSFVQFFTRLCKHRRALDGLPKPPFSFWFGHLPAIGKLMQSLPAECHPHIWIHLLRTQYKLPPVFYLDTWPFGLSICAILDPGVAYQVTVQTSLPKDESIPELVWPLTGEKTLVSMNGAEHKRWRAIFNPGFSSAHLMTLVDGIVDASMLFMEILGRHAEEQDIFSLEEAATMATVDIIGKVVLDTEMQAQTSQNDYIAAFRHQLKWLPKRNEFNPFALFNPMRPIIFQYNKWRMDRYVGMALEERFSSRPEKEAANSPVAKRNRPVVDLALDAYHEEKDDKHTSTGIDATFKKFAIDQIKTFMFAGHDTTSSTICYIAYVLSNHPEALCKVRQEYDEVFGTNVEQTPHLIKKDPHLINKLPYTVAIIKEVLRLYPPGSTARKGQPGFFLHHDGKQYPTEGFMVWPVSYTMHHSPDFWPSPDAFIPERWLAKEGDALFPVKGAWRPFEFGTRNCIGIELVMIETKIIMALMLRSFDTKVAYEELDARDAKDGLPMRLRTTPDGERAYQIMMATAKPVGGMPARVTKRKV